MKKIILLLLLSIPAYSQTSWFWQNPITQENFFHKVQFQNANLEQIIETPRIFVYDIDFRDRYIPTDTVIPVKIINIGTSDLYITKMQGPKLSNIFTPYIKNFDSSNPIIISPYEVFQFNVKFHPHDDLIYYDTIYFTSNSIKSGFFDSVAVLSGIGKKHIGAIIDVSDADFGSVCRYTKKYLPVTIRNDGDTNLFIIDYQLPVYYLFEPVIKHTINKNNPFIIQPNDSWTFNVLFSAPDITCIGFTDKITFTSNAVSGDSTAVLTVDSVVITGIDDFSYYQDELKITPNPFSNQITLDMTGNNKPETIIINDIFGRTVLTKHTEFLESGKTYNLRLTTDDLPPGVYFVRMSGSHSSRMMVKTE